MYEDRIVHGHAVELELICCAEGSDHRHSGSFYETVVEERVSKETEKVVDVR